MKVSEVCAVFVKLNTLYLICKWENIIAFTNLLLIIEKQML